MNIHHLELFYYVARHGGIMEAVRNIPYGIQQPAVSGQIAQLEEYLGTTLFQRRPFALTPAGKKVYQFIEPFFSNLEVLAAELQGGKTRTVRIGASTIVLRDHLPALFRNVRKKFPNIRIALREGYQADLEAMLDADQIDLAVTLIEKKSAPGIHALAMLEVPLTLLVEKSSAVTSLDQLWSRDKIEEPLICLPEVERICKNFQQGLGKIGVDWFPGIEASSIDIIETYVSSGFGIGLSVLVPKTELPETIRALPLPRAEFAPVVVGALWRGKGSTLIQAFVEELQAAARRLS